MMTEKGWMFSGGAMTSLGLTIGCVEIVKRYGRNQGLIQLAASAAWTKYRMRVPADEVYATEEDCREAAAKRLEATKADFDRRYETAVRVVRGRLPKE